MLYGPIDHSTHEHTEQGTCTLRQKGDELGGFMPLEDSTVPWDGVERRTLVRRRADSAKAGVLRKEVSSYMGEVVESDCHYCGGFGTVVIDDEDRPCWCQLSIE